MIRFDFDRFMDDASPVLIGAALVYLTVRAFVPFALALCGVTP